MVTEAQDDETRDSGILRLSVDVVAAFLGQNHVNAQAIPELIHKVHAALASLDNLHEPRPTEKSRPAVAIAKSVQEDYLVCLEDGKKLKMLKRYLRSKFDLSPEEYRRKWGLPPDYPMVAPAYAARRSDFAKQIGLGRGVRRRRAG